MPKKFKGENSKAVEARARKEEKATSEKEKKQKAIDDAYWQDDNKQLQKKQAKKEDAERKRLEALEKKKQREELLAQEDAENKSQAAKKGVQKPPKLTRAQIREDTEKTNNIEKPKAEVETHLTTPLEENINRVEVEGVEARTVDEALSVLSVKDTPEVDKHPEKRMKAAYEEFEKERIPQLKIENPTLRLSQLKQLLRKEWMKHPNNPLNMKLAAMQNKS